MNPMTLLSLKSSLGKFQENHPRFVQFIKAMSDSGIQEGTILECKTITPEGKEMTTNIKITQDDLELLDKLKELSKKGK